MADDHSDLGFVESTPVANAPSAAQPSSQDNPHDDLGFSPVDNSNDTVHKLLTQGFNFDDYSKLSPEKKEQYDALNAQMTKAFQEGAKQGASKGLTLNLKKDLFNTPEDVQQAISALPADQQDLAQKNASLGDTAGNVVGNLPIAAATGGATSLATKAGASALGLGSLGTKVLQGAGNVATTAGLGEVQGIGNSNAPTLVEKAQDALPSAALGGALGLGAEGLSAGLTAASSPAAQQVADQAGNSLRTSAENQAVKSLKPTPQQLLKMSANGKDKVIGSALLDAVDANGNTAYSALSNANDKANILASAKSNAGQAISDATKGLDSKVGDLLPDSFFKSEQAKEALKNLQAQRANIPDGITNTSSFIPDAKTASVTGLPEDTSLGFPRNDIDLQTGNVKSAIIPVEKLDPSAAIAKQNLDAQIQQVGQAIQNQPAKAQQIQSLLNKDQFVDDLEGQLMPALDRSGDPNGVKQLYSDWLSKLNNVGGEKAPIMSLDGLNQFKQELRQGVSYQGENANVVAQAKKDFTKQLNDLIIQKAKGVDQVAGTDLVTQLVKANKDYGALNTGSKVASQTAAKETLKSDLTTPALAATGYALKGATGGIEGAALGGVKSAVNKYGNNFAATSLNQLSNLVKESPQVLGEFAKPLQDAATRGSSALAAMHFALYQNNPEYRAKVDPLQEESEKQIRQNPTDNTPPAGQTQAQ